MKWAENFIVGKLLRSVSHIKISNPESLCNFIYDKDMLNLVLKKKNPFFCCIRIKGKIHLRYLAKSVIMINTL